MVPTTVHESIRRPLPIGHGWAAKLPGRDNTIDIGGKLINRLI
jgi:hypothetical protein